MEHHETVKKLSLILLAASLAISALIGIVILIIGDFTWPAVQILATTATLGVSSILILATSFLQARGRFVLISYAGVSVAVAGCALFIIGIWSEIEVAGFWKSAGSVAVVAASIAQVSLLLLIRPGHRLVRLSLYSTTAVVFALAVSLISGIAWEIDEGGFIRSLGVLAILDVLGSISTPLLRRITATVSTAKAEEQKG